MQPQRFFLLLVSTVLWGIWGICSSHDKISLQGKRISQMTGIHHVYLCHWLPDNFAFSSVCWGATLDEYVCMYVCMYVSKSSLDFKFFLFYSLFYMRNEKNNPLVHSN